MALPQSCEKQLHNENRPSKGTARWSPARLQTGQAGSVRRPPDEDCGALSGEGTGGLRRCLVFIRTQDEEGGPVPGRVGTSSWRLSPLAGWQL